MSSYDQLLLPRIDFSLLSLSTTGTAKWAATQALLMSAVEDYGCFEAIYDKIAPELQDSLFSKGMKDLFGLPLETKLKNTSELPYYGYIGNIPGREYESLNIDNATEREGVEEFLSLMWSDEGNPSLCDTIFEFSKHVSELGQMVQRMLLESLGMEKYFDRYEQSMTHSLRVAEYGGPRLRQPDQLSNIAMQSHTDVTALSIVCQHGVEGLEILSKDGQKWLKPSPYSFTVIIGQAFWV